MNNLLKLFGTTALTLTLMSVPSNVFADDEEEAQHEEEDQAAADEARDQEAIENSAPDIDPSNPNQTEEDKDLEAKGGLEAVEESQESTEASVLESTASNEDINGATPDELKKFDKGAAGTAIMPVESGESDATEEKGTERDFAAAAG